MVKRTCHVKIWSRAFQAGGGVNAKTLRQEQTWRVPEPDRPECSERVREQQLTRSRRELGTSLAGPCEVTEKSAFDLKCNEKPSEDEIYEFKIREGKREISCLVDNGLF